MSRYIDADKLKTIESIQSADFNSIESIRRWIDEQQTADVVKVVRCKDCKWWDGIECQTRAIDVVDDDEYCSYGERKEQEHETSK